MKKLFIISAILFYTLSIVAQDFTEQSVGISPMKEANCAFGDYDNDGDPDLILLGGLNSSITKFYNNDGGDFSEISAGFVGLGESFAAWCDYDLDGDLDVVVAGRESSGKLSTILYRNDETNFVETTIVLQGVKDASLTWNDYNNDGNPDLLVSGNDGSTFERFTRLYRNDGNGGFVDSEIQIMQSRDSMSAWADVDNDGDQDLFISGDSDFIQSRLYRNNGDNGFQEVDILVQGAFAGNAVWSEINGDHAMDLVVVGNNEYLESEGSVYENLEGFLFIESSDFVISGAALGSVATADYDNDGDQDVVECGKGSGCGLILSHLYKNENSANFIWEDNSFTAIRAGTCAWVDYDSDGFSDIFLAGTNSYESAYAKMWRNNGGAASTGINSAPTAPQNLYTEIEDDKVLFFWDKATDEQTPQDGLTYNLRVGTTPNGNEILSSMSLENGYRLIPFSGNTSNHNSWTLTDLPDGVYYWSVQAIDHSYIGSSFAEEGSFEVGNVNVENNNSTSSISLFPNPCVDKLSVSTLQSSAVAIYDLSGRVVYKQTLSKGDNIINVSNLKSGAYILKSGLSVERFFKK